MAKAKTTCPRCSNPNATPNAMGPDHIHCKKCGGLVPLKSESDTDYIGNNPLHNLIAMEEGHHNLGRIRTVSEGALRGGV